MSCAQESNIRITSVMLIIVSCAACAARAASPAEEPAPRVQVPSAAASEPEDSVQSAEQCEPGRASCARGEHCERGACLLDRRVTCPQSAAPCAKNQYCELKAGRSSCVDQPSQLYSVEDGYAVFACTGPADCGHGMQCCTGMLEAWHATYCAQSCDLSNTNTICSSVRDCARSRERVPPEQRRWVKLTCAALGDGAPAWLKSCHLDGE